MKWIGFTEFFSKKWWQRIFAISTLRNRQCYKMFLMCGIMVFSRLSGVTAYSYYMVDIIKNTRVTIVSPEWASAGITIFEIVGKTNLPWTTYSISREIFRKYFVKTAYRVSDLASNVLISRNFWGKRCEFFVISILYVMMADDVSKNTVWKIKKFSTPRIFFFESKVKSFWQFLEAFSFLKNFKIHITFGWQKKSWISTLCKSPWPLSVSNESCLFL